MSRSLPPFGAARMSTPPVDTRANRRTRVLLTIARRAVLAAAALVIGWSAPASASGPFPITEQFDSTSWGQFSHSGDAILTAAEGLDPDGEGWLRLNEGAGTTGSIWSDASFPSNQGWVIEFDYAMWNAPYYPWGADGFSFFLWDAAVPYEQGPGGGSLGYSGDGYGGLGANGLKGGVLGVGFDVYGNFSAQAPFTHLEPGWITLRGPQTLLYPILASHKVEGGLLTNEGDHSVAASGRKRSARIRISSEGDGRITVQMRKPGQPWTTPISNVPLGDDVPAQLKIGFTGTSGWYGVTDEIRRFNTTQPVDYAASVDDGRETAPRSELRTWTVEVENRGSSAPTQPLELALASEQGLDGVSWSCQTADQVSCGSGSGFEVRADRPVAPGATLTFLVRGRPSSTAEHAELTATARVTDPGLTDTDPSNNSATDTTALTSSPPTAVAGPDQTVNEGAVVALDAGASTDPEDRDLDYRWSLVSGEGPTPVLASSTGARTQFEALDDGKWTFRVTVDNGTGETSSDEVEITAKNVAPEIRVPELTGTQGGASVLSAMTVDAGALDRASAKIQWGDEATAHDAAVTPGRGWASIIGAHRYASAGTFDAILTVTDDDGGVATVKLDRSVIAAPTAIWAEDRDPGFGFSWLGARGRIEGTVHSNSSMKFAGAGSRAEGRLEYARSYLELGIGNRLSQPIRVTPSTAPAGRSVTAFKPGGAIAKQLGNRYHDMSSKCRFGVWAVAVATELSDGVYYAPCDIRLAAAHAKGKITVVSTGAVRFHGHHTRFSPYYDGLLALSSKTSGDAIDISGSDSRLAGLLDGRGADVDISGHRLRLTCGMVGNHVHISGTDVVVEGGDCSSPSGSVAGVRSIPEIQTGLTVDRPNATPGDRLNYQATVTNAQSDVFFTGIAGAQNAGDGPATISGAVYELRYRAVTGEWKVAASSAGDRPMAKLEMYPMTSPGVSYRGSGNNSAATVSAGALAAWGYQARVAVTPSLAKLLWDSGRVSAVESVVRLPGGGELVRELAPQGEDVTNALRAETADLQDAELTLALPSGATRFVSKAQQANLGRIGPGESRTVQVDEVLPPLAVRAEGETISAYAARLRSADGRSRRAASFTRAAAGGVIGLGPRQQVASVQQIPVVGLELSGPASMRVGDSALYQFGLENTGGAGAEHLTLEHTATAGSATIGTLPTAMAPNQRSEVTATFAAPATDGSVRQTGRLRWQDRNGNVYGAVEAGRTTTVRTPGALHVTKTVDLELDGDGNGKVSTGDTLEYEVRVNNTGGTALTGVEVVDPISERLSIVPASATASQGAAAVHSDAAGAERVEAQIGNLSGGATASMRFRALVLAPARASSKPAEIDNQAVVTSDQLQPERSDDPTTPEADDPTKVTAYPSVPLLTATQQLRRADGTGNNYRPAPGETVRLRTVFSNVGDRAATGVVMRIPAAQFQTFTPSTLQVSGGAMATIANGEIVARLDSLEPDRSIVIEVAAQVDAVLPESATELKNTAWVASNETARQDSELLTPVILAPRLVLTKTFELAKDLDGNGAISSGDEVAYRLALTNQSPGVARQVEVTDELDEFTTLVIGTLVASQGTAQGAGGTIIAAIGDLPGNGQAQITYRVKVGVLPPGQHELSSQAQASSPGLGAVRSDDPSAEGAQDATVVPVVSTPELPPSLSAKKRSWVSLDADGDGKPSPGDTLTYEVTAANAGPGNATGVLAADAVDSNVELVIGSVYAPQGEVLSGNVTGDQSVQVRFARLAANAQAVFTYQVKLPAALAPGVSTVESVGVIGSDQVGAVPSTGNSGGAVSTPITLPELVPPTVKFRSPQDGSTVTAPTEVKADVTAPQGQTIQQWCLTALRVGDEHRTTVKCGQTMAASGEVGTFDTTTLPNGAYVLTLDVTASGGGSERATTTVSVEGKLKPGRFVTSYTDMDLPIQTLPIRITRTYDSFDKSQGDFGIGWRVGLDGFRVSTNRPLGQGGWGTQESDCRVFFGERFCLSNTFRDFSSHTVTVTWPDGRAETFDFVPESKPGGVVAGGTAGFTARNGATSKLEVVGDQTVQFLGDGDLYEDDLTTVYEPTRFELTAKDGSKYVLDTESGLISSSDSYGNSLEIDDAGVRSSTGAAVRFTRDALGRITRIDGPSGESRSYAYSSAGDLQSVADSLGNSSRFEYDGAHNLTRTIDPAGRPISRLEFDSGGRLSAITDGQGNRTAFDTSEGGRQQAITSPDGKLVTISTSDERGNVTRVERVHDGQSRATTYAYDSNDNRVRETDPVGRVRRTAFDSRSNEVSVTDPAGNTTRFESDSAGRRVKSTDAQGNVTEFVRDPAGAVVQVKDPLGNTTRFEYDARGNRTASIDGLGRAVRAEYDPAGNQIRLNDGSGALIQSAYDSSGRLRAVTAAGVGTTRFEYDAEGRVTAMIDAAGGSTHYRYDAMGRLMSTTDPTGATTTTTYDAVGRRATVVDRAGVTTRYEYDARSRLTEKDSGGSQTSYAYDGAGRVVGAQNDDALVTVAYDDSDRPIEFGTKVTGDSSPDVVSYSYDVAGRRASMTHADVTDRYSYDAAGRVTQLASTQAGTFKFGYDAAGRRTEVQRPNGVASTYTYDAADSVVAIIHTRATGQTLDESRYSYDAAGRRTSLTTRDGRHEYVYDAAGRLVVADHPGQQPDESYVFDELGNRVSAGERYDAANRLQFTEDFRYEYDNEGRTTARIDLRTGDATRFTWATDGRLRAVKAPDGETVRYRYDPMGRRIEAVKGGTTKRQAYGLDPNAVSESVNGAQSRLTFALGYDQPLAWQRGGSSLYFAQDALSSVTATLSRDGDEMDRFTYDTAGQPISGVEGASPYTYAGREFDSLSGTYHYREREYDPSTGRFLSEDPVPATNLYAYGLGNPVSYNDPTGRIFNLSETAQTMATQSVIGAAVNGTVSFAVCRDLKSAGTAALGGAVAGLTVASGGAWLAKKVLGVVGGVANGGAVAVGMAALTYGWYTSVPSHYLANVGTAIDEDDVLGWMVGPAVQGVGAAAQGKVGTMIDVAAALGAQVLPWAVSDGGQCSS